MDFKSLLLSAFVAITPISAKADGFVGGCVMNNYADGVQTTHDFAIKVLSTPHGDVAFMVAHCMLIDPNRPVSMESLANSFDPIATELFNNAKLMLEQPNVEIIR